MRWRGLLVAGVVVLFDCEWCALLEDVDADGFAPTNFIRGCRERWRLGLRRSGEDEGGGEEMSGEEEREVCGILEYIWDDLCEVA